MQDTFDDHIRVQREPANRCISLDIILSLQSTVPFYGCHTMYMRIWDCYFQGSLIPTWARLSAIKMQGTFRHLTHVQREPVTWCISLDTAWSSRVLCIFIAIYWYLCLSGASNWCDLNGTLENSPSSLDTLDEKRSTVTSDCLFSSSELSVLTCAIHSRACCLTSAPPFSYLFNPNELSLTHQHDQKIR